ncbi:hypothetical protein B0H15DRAFT_849744 [Mycena belliarum]|uniref:Secreted protein n=1 Tax=Mycena belliarum TaxID=1033014 RepID=A0AAD6XPH1_9AGAR|nr:hypothetical protein B0H15DRAFT_849744 [Mycena belliae]
MRVVTASFVLAVFAATARATAINATCAVCPKELGAHDYYLVFGEPHNGMMYCIYRSAAHANSRPQDGFCTFIQDEGYRFGNMYALEQCPEKVPVQDCATVCA